MAKYEWKKGDKLIVVDVEGLVDDAIKLGEIVTANEDVNTDDNGCLVYIMKNDGHFSVRDWYIKRFRKISNEKVKKIKEVPVDLHLILIDSCKNFVAIKNSYKEAEDLARTRVDNVTIYKLIEVSSVVSQRVVKKIAVKRK